MVWNLFRLPRRRAEQARSDVLAAAAAHDRTEHDAAVARIIDAARRNGQAAHPSNGWNGPTWAMPRHQPLLTKGGEQRANQLRYEP